MSRIINEQHFNSNNNKSHLFQVYNWLNNLFQGYSVNEESLFWSVGKFVFQFTS